MSKDWLQQLQKVQEKLKPPNQEISLGRRMAHPEEPFVSPGPKGYTGPDRRKPSMTQAKFKGGKDEDEIHVWINEEERKQYANKLLETVELTNKRTAAETRTQNAMMALTVVTTVAIGFAMYKGITFETTK